MTALVSSATPDYGSLASPAIHAHQPSWEKAGLERLGIPRDHSKAVARYRKAAEEGDARAQLEMGIAYHRGRGVPQNDAIAARWWLRAADQGLAEAQFLLGAAYVEGLGVATDYVEAYKWFSLADAQLEGKLKRTALDFRKTLAKNMSHEQLAEAQTRARRWKPTRGK
jgi:TPR repeat protein